MNQLEYLTRCSEGYRPTPAETLDYLETCLRVDRLSRDSREQLRGEISQLKAKIAAASAAKEDK